jgi:hypothetical protein
MPRIASMIASPICAALGTMPSPGRRCPHDRRRDA